ncbi:endo-1,4-beta-xylanase [Paenibacillus motobuensis]|uniref:endo-1,4-beta-xylanase n=1 Tax=Paenibacillus TaxID=44249 RepID=UPI00203D65B4|nr:MULTISPECIES: endo-1,4-beta-xylanase [Paenibacillus]MCM3041208.1 endo-1,4-beta-xylanase [Paenibacillus lutimineralis]MCM3648312.1 endo-1,4-beta-xylanase [Paenibacillus motobuensis]
MLKSKWISLFVAIMMLSGLLLSAIAEKADASLASGSKFLGNVIGSSAPSDFTTYWNQVTPENATKWGSVESTRNTMNWSNADLIYNYAQTNKIPFKFHTLVWGSQEPGWIGSLSAADQKAEVTEWIKLAGQRYPTAEYVDVVNEPLHAKPSYRNAIGGDGTTGWDWVIWSFQQAREAFPNSKLLINDYGIISDPNAASQYLTIINLLKDRGLVDGIGIQCHYFNMDNVSVSTMNSVLNSLSATGLPIYVSELDMTGDDATQLSRYQTKFPVLWENPNVKGITLWGYIQGETWVSDTHLVTSSGAERPAMQWLKQYLGGGGTPVIPAAPTGLTATAGNAQVALSWAASSGATSYTVKQATTSGGPYTDVATNLTTTSYTKTGLTNGTVYYYVVTATNAAGTSGNSTQVSATPSGGGGNGGGNLVVQYKAQNTNASSNTLAPNFVIKNNGTSAVSLSNLKIRYYFTKDGNQALNSYIDWAAVGNSNVSAAFGSTTGTNADTYLEISFGSGAGSIAPGATSGDIQTRIAKADWSNFNQSNDYSYDPTKTSFTDWNKVTIYQSGTLVWGIEP